MQTMIAKIVAGSPLNDVNPGSVIRTILESAATEDFKQYYEMLNIINNYSLDRTTGADLDDRAIEAGLSSGRIKAKKSFGEVSVSDSAITKKATKLYAGLNGPVKGQFQVFVDDASVLNTSSGSLIIGRTTVNTEIVPFTTITFGTNYDTIHLSAALNNDHGTDETVILSQGGNRIISAGTVVKVPPADFGDSVLFSVNFETTILDGEDKVDGVLVTCLVDGVKGNVPAGSIREFDSKPFPTAVVSNPSPFRNGRDIENDAQLRDRIKATIQSLSRGTPNAIKNSVLGIIDPTDNKRVVSANFIDTTSVNGIGQLIIDDGSGFEPTFSGQGLETLVAKATGGEQFLQARLFPAVKALIVTVNSEPYSIANNMTLTYKVSNLSETVTFTDADFAVSGSASAQEVAAAINNKATLIEARTTNSGSKVEIRAKVQENEDIQVIGGTANSIGVLNFPSNKVETILLYKLSGNKLIPLSKDGVTALIENTLTGPFDFSLTPTFLDVQLDNETMFLSQAGAGSGLNSLVDIKLGQKFPNSSIFYGKKVTFLSGLNEGLTADINSYDGTGTLTLTGGLTVAQDDQYQIEDVERIFFSNVPQVDFLSPQTVTPSQVVDIINAQIKGLASLSGDGTNIFIISKLEQSENSAVKVWGGTANTLLGFPTEKVVGRNRDFIYNRFNGQVELISPLKSGESITAGSRLTRAFLIGSLPQPYILTNGDSITIVVDGGTPQVITFVPGDFSSMAQASAQEVVNVINRDGKGITAEVTSDNKIMIQTSTFDLTGSIEVSSTLGTGRNLGFEVGVEIENLLSHTAFLVADNLAPYHFVEGDRLVVVLDNNIVTKTFNIQMDLAGTVTAPVVADQSFIANITSISQNFKNKFELDDELVDYRMIWKTGLNAGEERLIIDYKALTTGEIVLDSSLPNSISANDTFIILPVTLKNVVSYLSNTSSSTLSLNAEVSTAVDGTKLQITTKENGSAGFVNVTGSTANRMLNELVQSGTGKNVYVDSSLYKPGMKVKLKSEGSFSESEMRITNKANGITTDPSNVNVAGAFSIVVDQQGAGQPEITDVTLRADASNDLNGRSWFLNSANNIVRYYVWYHTSAAAVNDPSHAGKIGIRVDIATNATANQVATATAAAIDALAAFSCPAPGASTITVTNSNIGVADDVLDFSVGGAFTILVTQQGVASTPESFKAALPAASSITESQYWLVNAAEDVREYYVWYNKNLGLKEITQATMRADVTNDLNGKHWLLNSASDKNKYYVWYHTFSEPVIDPMIVGRIGVRVDIPTDALALDVAIETAIKLDELDDFTAPTPVTAVVEITNVIGGATTDALDGDVGGAFAINVTQQGTLGDPLQFTPALSSKIGVEVVIDPSDDNTLVGTKTALALNSISDFSGIVPYKLTQVVAVTPNDPQEGIFKLELADEGEGYLTSQGATIERTDVLNFSNIPQQGRDGYRYYTGLLRTVQRTIDGLDISDTFPGVKAAGVQIEVKAPTIQRLRFEIDVDLAEGVSINVVSDDLKNAVLNYVNSLGIGQDVILTEIIDRIMDVTGVLDVRILTPVVNTAIADNEIARVSLEDVTIG